MIDDGLPPGDPKDREITRLRAENELLRALLKKAEQLAYVATDWPELRLSKSVTETRAHEVRK